MPSTESQDNSPVSVSKKGLIFMLGVYPSVTLLCSPFLPTSLSFSLHTIFGGTHVSHFMYMEGGWSEDNMGVGPCPPPCVSQGLLFTAVDTRSTGVGALWDSLSHLTVAALGLQMNTTMPSFM